MRLYIVLTVDSVSSDSGELFVAFGAAEFVSSNTYIHTNIIRTYIHTYIYIYIYIHK